MLDQLIEWLKDFNETIEISVLEDNKYVTQENAVFQKDQFVREIAKHDFCIQGMGDREFYISIQDQEFTIQVSNFTYETSLQL